MTARWHQKPTAWAAPGQAPTWCDATNTGRSNGGVE